jgi:probable F420-dependent oxidoreductase
MIGAGLVTAGVLDYRSRREGHAMKFGLMYANAGPFGYPEPLTHLARTAEEVGIESIWTVEHVVIPVGYKSTYPYDPSGRIPFPESVPIPDPLLPLAFAAAVTKKLRLATGILILPQRHPLYVAKEVATLDVLSGGRMILGIGVGWLQEEFDALGIPFDTRAARTRECVRAIRSLWKDEPEPFEGSSSAGRRSSRTRSPCSVPACRSSSVGTPRARRAARRATATASSRASASRRS